MNSRPKEITLFSPAKVNLGLRIVGKRANGYHELQSLFWPLSLGDQVTVTPAGTGPRIRIDWRGAPPEPDLLPLKSEKNLAWRALQLLHGENPPLQLLIEKRIPLGGGLGGGSSNAGSLLRNWLSQAQRSPEWLVEKATTLGADVPFFLWSRPAMVSGIGEKVEPLPIVGDWIAQLRFLLMTLPIPTSTPAVFAELRREPRFSPPYPTPTGDWEEATLRRYLEASHNDLEPAAVRVNPLIGQALAALRQTNCAFAGLSGSGSTCFGVFFDEASRQESDKALQRFCREHQCRTLKAETFTEQHTH